MNYHDGLNNIYNICIKKKKKNIYLNNMHLCKLKDVFQSLT